MPDLTPDIHYDAFISYARRDGRDLAERLYRALKENGLRPWRDERDLNPYQDMNVGIERAIRTARYVVVLLTPDVTREESFVRREIVQSLLRKKPIIPLIGPDFDPADVPININGLTWLPFTNFDEHLSGLLNRLAQSPDAYTAPALPHDPFRPYLEGLLDFVNQQLESSLLNLDELLVVTTADTPDAVAAPPPPSPTFRAWVMPINQRSSPPKERATPNLNAGFIEYKGRILLLGEPGAGKTTALLAFAREKVNDRLVNPAALLPILTRLASWDGNHSLSEWLAGESGLPANAIEEEIAERRVLLILDGLDEMPAEYRDPDKPDADPRDLRLECLDMLKSVASAALVSCRVRDYDDIVAKGGERIALNGAVTLQPLTDDQIRAYLTDQPELWDALVADSALLDMARTPLLLTLLGVGYRDSSPEERARLRHLSASPGDLRDRIFERYVRARYDHEALRSPDPLPFTLDELTDGLGRAVMRALSDHLRRDSTLVAERDFDTMTHRTAMTALAVHLHLLQPLGLGEFLVFTGIKEMRWRFLHLLLRDYFAFQAALIALRDPNRDVRVHATRALGRLGDPRAVVPLITVLHDSTSLVQGSAISALGRLGDLGAVDPLIAILQHPDTSLRSSAAAVLGALGDSRAVDPLIAALADPHERVRSSAASALGRLGEPALHPLITALADPHKDVRRGATVALGRLGDPRAVQPLITALADPHKHVRWDAADALGRLGDPRAVDPLIAALTDPDELVRSRVASALGQLADPRAVDPLINALADPHKHVRWSAADALGDLADPRALDPLIAALADPDEHVRSSAASALGQLGNARAVQPLILLLSDNAETLFMNRVCDAAAEALERIATPEARAAVEEWRQSNVGKNKILL
jgi:HEAT repeat protein